MQDRDVYLEVLWDRLAGNLMEYIKNYELSKSDKGEWKIEPSYNVDYEIEEEIISELYRTLEAKDCRSFWYHQVEFCTNINELPLYLKKLVEQFLPRFLSEYPQYQDAECLKIEG